MANAFKRVGDNASVVGAYDAESDLAGLVIPGVASFRVVPQIVAALGGLKNIAKVKIPVLCICLGMQALFRESEESKCALGLGIVPGKVRKINGGLRLPQLGWNSVKQEKNDPLFYGIKDGQYFYFANSYASFPQDAKTILGTTRYGEKFVSVVRNQNWWGVQFHPEKSGGDGLRMIGNFAEICKEWGK